MAASQPLSPGAKGSLWSPATFTVIPLTHERGSCPSGGREGNANDEPQWPLDVHVHEGVRGDHRRKECRDRKQRPQLGSSLRVARPVPPAPVSEKRRSNQDDAEGPQGRSHDAVIDEEPQVIVVRMAGPTERRQIFLRRASALADPWGLLELVPREAPKLGSPGRAEGIPAHVHQITVILEEPI